LGTKANRLVHPRPSERRRDHLHLRGQAYFGRLSHRSPSALETQSNKAAEVAMEESSQGRFSPKAVWLWTARYGIGAVGFPPAEPPFGAARRRKRCGPAMWRPAARRAGGGRRTSPEAFTAMVSLAGSITVDGRCATRKRIGLRDAWGAMTFARFSIALQRRCNAWRGGRGGSGPGSTVAILCRNHADFSIGPNGHRKRRTSARRGS